MKSLSAITLAILMASASSLAAAGTFSSGGNLKPTAGPMRPTQPHASTYRAKPPAAAVTTPRSYGSTGSTSTLGPDRFTPYKGTSVYSDRGGVNAYPKPAKPKGYIDTYGKSGF